MIIKYLDVIAPVVLVIYLIVHLATKKSETEDSSEAKHEPQTEQQGYQPSFGMKVFIILLLLFGAALSLLSLLVK